MSMVLLIIIAAVPAYLLGSLNGAIITSQVFYRKDIRKYGSGNPGLTNFFRVFGKGGVLLVIFIDVIKTITPVVFGGGLFSQFSEMPISEALLFSHFFDVALFGTLVSGFFVIIGHCFPVFYGFKGGKGVMTSGTMVWAIDWRIALICWVIFLIIVLSTRYVSLGAMLACLSVPFAQYFLIGLGGYLEFITALLCALLVIVRHESNIRRLLKGQESKLSFEKKEQQN